MTLVTQGNHELLVIRDDPLGMPAEAQVVVPALTPGIGAGCGEYRQRQTVTHRLGRI